MNATDTLHSHRLFGALSMEIELNLTRFNRTLDNLLRGLQNATELTGLIGEEMTLAVDQRFREEVDPDGSPWAALSPDYVKWKERKGFIPKILQMRGDLRARVAYQAYPDRVEIGSDTIYARRQHEKRPFLYGDSGLGRRDQQRIEAVVEEYLRDLAYRR